MCNVIQDRVRRGAELLDQECPGWAEVVPTDEQLRIDDGFCCVLGHVFGNYQTAIRALAFRPSASGTFYAADYGFSLYGHELECFSRVEEGTAESRLTALAAAWRREIARRVPPSPADPSALMLAAAGAAERDGRAADAAGCREIAGRWRDRDGEKEGGRG